MAEEKLTYAGAGVDIEAANRAVKLLAEHVKSTHRPGVLGGIGGFGGLFRLPLDKCREPVLVGGTDGVGTKLRLAFALDIHDTIGIDAVAMCVNDILVQGAEPLFFLDYLAVGKLEPEQVAAIVSGVAAGCREAGCALLGGETVEMPGFYPPGEYDLAGFAVGMVEAEKIIDGSTIVPGDIILGLPSSGLHSNGFSLARKALLEEAKYSLDRYFPELGRTLGEELLTPTKIYVKEVLPLLDRYPIKGLAHITGGGLVENIPRILPPGCRARIQCTSWQVPPIFQLIRQAGRISTAEMYRVFNMGIGMAIIAAPEVAQGIRASFGGSPPPVIGEIVAGEGALELVEGG